MHNSPKLHANKFINMFNSLLARLPKQRQDWLLSFLKNTGKRAIGQAALAILLCKTLPIAIPKSIHGLLGKIPGIRLMYRTKPTVASKPNEWVSALRKLQKINISNLTTLGPEAGMMIEAVGTVGATYITTRMLGRALKKIKKRFAIPAPETENTHKNNTITLDVFSNSQTKTKQDAIKKQDTKKAHTEDTSTSEIKYESYLEMFNKKDTHTQPSKYATNKPIHTTSQIKTGFAKGDEIPPTIGNKIPNQSKDTNKWDQAVRPTVIAVLILVCFMCKKWNFSKLFDNKTTNQKNNNHKSVGFRVAEHVTLTAENLEKHAASSNSEKLSTPGSSPIKTPQERGYIHDENDNKSDNTSNSGDHDILDLTNKDQHTATKAKF